MDGTVKLLEQMGLMFSVRRARVAHMQHAVQQRGSLIQNNFIFQVPWYDLVILKHQTELRILIELDLPNTQFAKTCIYTYVTFMYIVYYLPFTLFPPKFQNPGESVALTTRLIDNKSITNILTLIPS